MAESADILTAPEQKVVLPDLAAGCSMADMARLAQVEDAWDALTDAGIADLVVPVTYMNSSADIKAFCGRNGGVVCTSSNADVALEWAFEQHGPTRKVLFLPDQHLGRNTAVLKMGYSLDDCVVWNPLLPDGGLTAEELRAAKVILWRGHCSVHGRFTADVVDELRATYPGINILVHPECTHDVVLKADLVGLDGVHHQDHRGGRARHHLGDRHRAQPRQAAGRRPPGQAHRLPGPQRLLLLDDEPDRPAPPGVGHGVAGRRASWSTRSRSTPTPSSWAKVALQRMLDLPGKSHRD